MIQVPLYRYKRTNGVVTITPNKENEEDEMSQMRLIAEEGKVLKNGAIIAPCIDCPLEEIDEW